MCTDGSKKLVASNELDGLVKKDAIPAALQMLEKAGMGKGK